MVSSFTAFKPFEEPKLDLTFQKLLFFACQCGVLAYAGRAQSAVCPQLPVWSALSAVFSDASIRDRPSLTRGESETAEPLFVARYTLTVMCIARDGKCEKA